MVLNHFGKNISYDIVKSKINIDQEGVSAYEIIRVSKSYGLKAIGYKNYSIYDIKNFPVIAHTINNNIQHFVVISNVTNRWVFLKDPSKGEYYISLDEFKKIYTGIIILFKENNTIINKNIINKRFILLITFILLFFTFLNISCSYLMSYIIENFKLLNKISLLIILFFILGLTKELFSLLKDRLLLKNQLLTDKSITIPTLKKIINLPHAFYQNKPIGELISKINDLSYIKEMFFAFVQILFVNLLIIFISFIFIFFINKFIFLLNVIILCLIFIYHKKFYAKNSYKNYDLQVKNELLNAKISNGIESITSIKNLSKEHYFIRKIEVLYNDIINDYRKISILYQNKNFIFQLIIFILSSLSIVILIYNNTSITNVLFINYIESVMYDSIAAILNLWPLYVNAKASYVRINEVYKEKDIEDNGILLDIKSIVIKNLTYKISYRVLFKNLNLSFCKGEFIMLNGPSGSGKTTLFKIITKQINCNSKNIFINKNSINLYNQDTLRKSITYVDQKIKLFNDTVLENIELGKSLNLKPNFKMVLEKELKKGNIDYKVCVDNTNSNLSGGQLSLIKIAQALNNAGSVIVFDETTNQMDVHLERKVLKAIKKDYQDKIIILISHRLSNRDLFDKTINFSSKKQKERRKDEAVK